MAPSMKKKVVKEKKVPKALGVMTKEKRGKKMKAASLQREEVEKSLRIAERIAQQDSVPVRDDGSSDDGYVRKRRVGAVRVPDDERSEDDGFYVDRGELGIVKVKAEKMQVVETDDRKKRPKVVNSLKSLRLAIAVKKKQMQDKEVSKILQKKGFSSDDEEE